MWVGVTVSSLGQPGYLQDLVAGCSGKCDGLDCIPPDSNVQVLTPGPQNIQLSIYGNRVFRGNLS